MRSSRAQHRSWIFPRDPDFAAKAERVLDLYERCWQGRRLRPDEYVVSADEKSQLQALRRRHQDLPPGPQRTRRVEFEYSRRGKLAYLAALDVHHATVMGRCAPTTGIAPFGDLASPRTATPRLRDRYNATASPFNCRYTKADLNAYLDRLATRESLNPAA